MIGFPVQDLLHGVIVNATYDSIKLIWKKCINKFINNYKEFNQKSLNELFDDAFQKAIKTYRPHLEQYAKEGGEISLDKTQLDAALQEDLCIDWDNLSLDLLSNPIRQQQLQADYQELITTLEPNIDSICDRVAQEILTIDN